MVEGSSGTLSHGYWSGAGSRAKGPWWQPSCAVRSSRDLTLLMRNMKDKGYLSRVPRKLEAKAGGNQGLLSADGERCSPGTRLLASQPVLLPKRGSQTPQERRMLHSRPLETWLRGGSKPHWRPTVLRQQPRPPTKQSLIPSPGLRGWSCKDSFLPSKQEGVSRYSWGSEHQDFWTGSKLQDWLHAGSEGK